MLLDLKKKQKKKYGFVAGTFALISEEWNYGVRACYKGGKRVEKKGEIVSTVFLPPPSPVVHEHGTKYEN